MITKYHTGRDFVKCFADLWLKGDSKPIKYHITSTEAFDKSSQSKDIEKAKVLAKTCED